MTRINADQVLSERPQGRIFVTLLMGLSLTFLCPPAFGETNVRVSPGDTEQISAHGTCLEVTNLGGVSIMIPIRTPQACVLGGGAFLRHAPDMPTLTLAPCTFKRRTLSCGELSAPKTIQSFFSEEEWASPDIKILTVPSSCDVCLIGTPGGYAMSIGDAPWGGQLTLEIKGDLMGGSVRPGEALINTLDVNQVGDSGQKINLIVDGGRIIGGGRDGADGQSAMFTTHTGTMCSASITSGSCTNMTYHAMGGAGGEGGRGEHCGAPPEPGMAGYPGGTIGIPDDRLWTTQVQECRYQSVYVWPDGFVWQNVCEWVTRYYATFMIRYVTGPSGESGRAGSAGGRGIRNIGSANIELLNGGTIRGY